MDFSALNENWKDICAKVKSYPDVDLSQINAFFSRLQPQAMSEGFLMLTADNEFIRKWVEHHYTDIIKRALDDLYHVPFTLIIEVDDASSSKSSSRTSEETLRTHQDDDEPLSKQAPTIHPSSTSSSPLNDVNTDIPRQVTPSYSSKGIPNKLTRQDLIEYTQNDEDDYDSPSSLLTFENFVIGSSNRMAYSMAVEVAEMPGETILNPLFIYGKSGLGKTHLMRAIQNYIRETAPQLHTVYVDSAELLSDFTEASAAHDKEKLSFKNFKTHYEAADILLIDDIQYLQGKTQTLDMVFQIFKKQMDRGKQIVLSADRAPKNIDIDERYHSRFNQGGTIDIQPPEIETKLGIVKSFINQYRKTEGFSSFTLSDEIQMYIAENSSSNIRELKSAITKVIYQATIFGQPDLTISDVRVLLENHFSGGSSKSLTVEDIQKEVENFYKIKHSDIVGPGRARNIVYPRQIAIYLCRQMLDLSLNSIAKKFNRDHSTAIHSVSSVERMMRDSREVQEEIETLKHIIRES